MRNIHRERDGLGTYSFGETETSLNFKTKRNKTEITNSDNGESHMAGQARTNVNRVGEVCRGDLARRRTE